MEVDVWPSLRLKSRNANIQVNVMLQAAIKIYNKCIMIITKAHLYKTIHMGLHWFPYLIGYYTIHVSYGHTKLLYPLYPAHIKLLDSLGIKALVMKIQTR